MGKIASRENMMVLGTTQRVSRTYGSKRARIRSDGDQEGSTSLTAIASAATLSTANENSSATASLDAFLNKDKGEKEPLSRPKRDQNVGKSSKQLPLSSFFTPQSSIGTVTSPASRRKSSPAYFTHVSDDDFKATRSNDAHSSPSSTASSTRKRKRLSDLFPISSKQPKKTTPRYEQLYLDLGQKNLFSYTCPECRMSYARGRIEDDALHERYHKASIGGIDYSGYKDEDIVDRLEDADERYIVQITGRSSAFMRKKAGGRLFKGTSNVLQAKEVLSVVNLELGSIDFTDQDLVDCKTLLCVSAKRKKVIGCVLLERIDIAYRLVSAQEQDENEPLSLQSKALTSTKIINVDGGAVFCSDRPQRAICGISRIWVSRKYRGQGIGRRLLKAASAYFIFGYRIPPDEMAFSQPTADGRKLAESFTRRKDFLVYSEHKKFIRYSC
ncbi:hypothetical protein BZG36_01873 [Bifiguratus adelaidae]|uniref:N-acetyltransferase domain-containing protein n=1 Tax=Bifiguratus adelaidae TaxID=1938954 RepID=A0A261Y2H8_9FUNG|nr:hypothetical protein BZG36_01873 [Bifiguratus adelaidae]